MHFQDEQIEVHRWVVGPWENNVFVLRCRATGEAVLIDAANEHERLLEVCERLDVRRVLETHGHHDHIQAVAPLREAGYEVGVTAADAPMLADQGYDVLIGDDEVITVGRVRLRTIATPGHTPGSICFRVEGSPVLFSGDTLFPGGPGNTKGAGGDFPTIITSIEDRLFGPLDAGTLVLPGHGLDTTIGTEQPALDEWVARGLVSGAEPDGPRVFPIDLRAVDHTPVRTAALPDTPTRERTIPATAWVEAPGPLLDLGAGIGDPVVAFIRRIGPWLLWRAGPPRGAEARYLAVAAADPTQTWRFDLAAAGDGSGEGPDGAVHTRFRSWKEALRDVPPDPT